MESKVAEWSQQLDGEDPVTIKSALTRLLLEDIHPRLYDVNSTCERAKKLQNSPIPRVRQLSKKLLQKIIKEPQDVKNSAFQDDVENSAIQDDVKNSTSSDANSVGVNYVWNLIEQDGYEESLHQTDSENNVEEDDQYSVSSEVAPLGDNFVLTPTNSEYSDESPVDSEDEEYSVSSDIGVLEEPISPIPDSYEDVSPDYSDIEGLETEVESWTGSDEHEESPSQAYSEAAGEVKMAPAFSTLGVSPLDYMALLLVVNGSRHPCSEGRNQYSRPTLRKTKLQDRACNPTRTCGFRIWTCLSSNLGLLSDQLGDRKEGEPSIL